MPGLKISLKGVDKEIERITRIGDDLRGTPMESALKDSALMVEATAKREAPVFTGRLRSSIKSSVVRRGKTISGVVGSNVEYAPFMELGTRPFWPPVSALQMWADRKGVNAFLVARAISRRGLKARLFLIKGLMKNRTRIAVRLGRNIDGIITRRSR